MTMSYRIFEGTMNTCYKDITEKKSNFSSLAIYPKNPRH